MGFEWISKTVSTDFKRGANRVSRCFYGFRTSTMVSKGFNKFQGVKKGFKVLNKVSVGFKGFELVSIGYMD